MYQIQFRLNISPEQYLAYYQGVAKRVVVKMADGRTMQFPANILRPFLLTNGVVGDFVIRFDQQHRLIDINRVADTVVR